MTNTLSNLLRSCMLEHLYTPAIGNKVYLDTPTEEAPLQPQHSGFQPWVFAGWSLQKSEHLQPCALLPRHAACWTPTGT